MRDIVASIGRDSSSQASWIKIGFEPFSDAISVLFGRYLGLEAPLLETAATGTIRQDRWYFVLICLRPTGPFLYPAYVVVAVSRKAVRDSCS